MDPVSSITQRFLQSLFNGIYALFANLISPHRFSDDAEQVINIGFLLCSQRFSVMLQYTVVHQSVWYDRFELEMRVITESALPTARLVHLKDWLNQHNLDWVVSNEPSLEMKISAEVDLNFSATTTLTELGGLAVTVAQHFSTTIDKIKTYNQT